MSTNTLTNKLMTVLVCTACGAVVCPYCYFDEDMGFVSSSECQGHIGELTPECNHEEPE